MLKNATYTGITPRVLGLAATPSAAGAGCSGALPNCGKGQPMQVAHVGHGAAPARFRDVRVGVV